MPAVTAAISHAGWTRCELLTHAARDHPLHLAALCRQAASASRAPGHAEGIWGVRAPDGSARPHPVFVSRAETVRVSPGAAHRAGRGPAGGALAWPAAAGPAAATPRPQGGVCATPMAACAQRSQRGLLAQLGQSAQPRGSALGSQGPGVSGAGGGRARCTGSSAASQCQGWRSAPAPSSQASACKAQGQGQCVPRQPDRGAGCSVGWLPGAP